MAAFYLPVEASTLGKRVAYVDNYCPDLLFPIARQGKRHEIGVPTALPFFGADMWTAFELSWLNPRGKPQIATATLVVPCTSPAIVESKSLKLYLNSLNNTTFDSATVAADLIRRDVSRAVDAPIEVHMHAHAEPPAQVGHFSGTCLDDQDISCDTYAPHPEFLSTDMEHAEQTVYSHLLKSNCLVTGQPDWGSVQIHYAGRRIDPVGLLRYIVSFRNHNEFHEQCVERMFMDISRRCAPDKLTVYARYTRRGGLDINPYRSSVPGLPEAVRLWRQ